MTTGLLLALIGLVILIQLAAALLPVLRRQAAGHPGALAMGRDSLLTRDVLPFAAALAALAGAALAIDALLHVLDVVWIGRYLGIPGVLLILGSFGHALRKRRLITWGDPVRWLRLHEAMAWAGSLLILVHAGVHFNAILGWLAVWAMLINVASGLTGKYLLHSAKRHLNANRRQTEDDGLTPAEVEARLYWDSLTFDTLKKWRLVHRPITLAFAVLATAHILAVFLFWGWK